MGLIRNITTVLRAWLLVAVLCVVSCSKGDIQDFVGVTMATAKATPRKTTLRCSCWATILLRQPVQ